MSENYVAMKLKLHRADSMEHPEADVLSSILFELGAEGIEWSPPCSVVASFSVDADTRSSLEHSVASSAEPFASLVETKALEPVDWTTHWQHHFHPVQVGSLFIVPSWLQAPDGAEHVLWIDPSSAFGTGLHPTTHLCLEEIVAKKPARVLDVGTGTGILAMAAVKFGATAVGTDNDPEAIRVAMENRRRNCIDTLQLNLTDAPLPDVEGQFPFVVANILAAPLEAMAEYLVAKLQPQATLLLSGVLEEQVGSLVETYEALGCRFRSKALRFGSGAASAPSPDELEGVVESWAAVVLTAP